MQVRPLAINGAYEMTPVQHADDRGVFLEWFKASVVEGIAGRRLDLVQANCSVSAAGALRGIHVTDVPPGQAKYVMCVAGAVMDVVVDLRVGSPTFGGWDSVLLDDVMRRQVYISEGIGHAFVALEDGSTVVYLCSSGYTPERDRRVDPFDPAIGVQWPTTGRDGRPLDLQLSPQDRAAPSLAEAAAQGLLPAFAPAS